MIFGYKEVHEIDYSLHLFHDSNYIDNSAFSSLIADCEELTKILSSITKTMKLKTKIRD